MPEVLIGDILCRQPHPSSVGDRGDYLTDYIAQGGYRSTRRQVREGVASYWRGAQLKGSELREFTINLSEQIDRVWEKEYQHSEGRQIDIGAYCRTALIAKDLANNVLEAARQMVASGNSEEVRVGKNILFHRYFNSALSAICLIRFHHPYLNFDSAPLIEEATVVVTDLIFNHPPDSSYGVALAIHRKVSNLAIGYLRDLTGLPSDYLIGRGDYQGARGFIIQYMLGLDRLPTATTLTDHIPSLSRYAADDLLRQLGRHYYPDQGLKQRLATALNQFYSHQPEMWEPADNYDQTELANQIEDVLDSLKGKERRVLMLRLGLEDDKQWTLEEVGREFGVTHERIRQIETKALKKLHHLSRTSRLTGYTLGRRKENLASLYSRLLDELARQERQVWWLLRRTNLTKEELTILKTTQKRIDRYRTLTRQVLSDLP